MLTELRVENLGIIAELTVTIGPGLTAITGETGAGKTLLIEALQLLLGARSDGSLVREGHEEARVDGRFLCGDDEVVLSRVVPREGRSRAYMNGRPVAAGELADCTSTLVDLHGQHEQQSLLVPASQRLLLDSWIGDAAFALRSELAKSRERLAELAEKLQSLGGDDRARTREAELLAYQLQEIHDAGIASPDEDQKLVLEEALLGDAESHRSALSQARSALSEHAVDALGLAISALVSREPFEAFAERIRVAQDGLADIAQDLRHATDKLVSDPERLQEVRDRLLRLRELRRKYGESLASVIEFRDESEKRLSELRSYEAVAASIEDERAAVAASRTEAAQLLTSLRVEHEPALSKAVTEQLRVLALPQATFRVVLEPTEIQDDGADRVTFELAPNKGEPSRSLAKAASGGELSRSMLAIRSVLSQAPPTLVFDEVDAGIGGEAGIAVGRALAALGSKHQVLCVTHLAQVAAHADSHLHVSKKVVADRTVAHAELLSDEVRVTELSRMLGGSGDSLRARSHAEELLATSARCATSVKLKKPRRADA